MQQQTDQLVGKWADRLLNNTHVVIRFVMAKSRLKSRSDVILFEDAQKGF